MGRNSDDKKPLQQMSLNSSRAPNNNTLFSARSSTSIGQPLYGVQGIPVGSSPKMNFQEVKPSTVVLKADPYRAFLDNVKVEGCASVNLFSQHNGGESLNNTISNVYQSGELTGAYGDAHNHSRLDARGSGAGRSLSREKSVATDRQRRLRIADRLKALQELLPYTIEGGQLTLLDEVIDHVKYLQLQIMDLSQTKLGFETASDPVIYLEGRGRYMLHEEMLDEPLEETIEKLFQLNSSAAIQLLESRGLYIVPTSLVDDLDQAV